jgi:hypothetical protein
VTERRGFKDEEAQRIIQRAAEIDLEESRRLDAPALREIAAEAGISEAALDRALQEHQAPLPVRRSWFQRHPVLATFSAIIGSLLVLGFLRSWVMIFPD